MTYDKTSFLQGVQVGWRLGRWHADDDINIQNFDIAGETQNQAEAGGGSNGDRQTFIGTPGGNIV